MPKDHTEAEQIDSGSRNTKWVDAIKSEMKDNRVAFEEEVGEPPWDTWFFEQQIEWGNLFLFKKSCWKVLF